MTPPRGPIWALAVGNAVCHNLWTFRSKKVSCMQAIRWLSHECRRWELLRDHEGVCPFWRQKKKYRPNLLTNVTPLWNKQVNVGLARCVFFGQPLIFFRNPKAVFCTHPPGHCIRQTIQHWTDSCSSAGWVTEAAKQIVFSFQQITVLHKNHNPLFLSLFLSAQPTNKRSGATSNDACQEVASVLVVNSAIHFRFHGFCPEYFADLASSSHKKETQASFAQI